MSWEEKHQLFPQNAAKTSRKKFPPSTAWDGDIFLFRLAIQTNLCHSNGDNSVCEVYISIPSHQCVKTSWIETWRFEIANLGGSPWVEQTSREAEGSFHLAPTIWDENPTKPSIVFSPNPRPPVCYGHDTNPLLGLTQNHCQPSLVSSSSSRPSSSPCLTSKNSCCCSLSKIIADNTHFWLNFEERSMTT